MARRQLEACHPPPIACIVRQARLAGVRPGQCLHARPGRSRAGDFQAWERFDRLQRKLGGLVALFMVAALVLGGSLFVAG